MGVESFITHHTAVWREATYHPFLDGVRDGTLSHAAFQTWLAQDYLFVVDLLAFQARLLARSPRHAQAVLAGGLVALEAELTWFEQHAASHRITLTTTRQPTAERYRRFLSGLEDAPFAAAITSLWALERAYMEAWQSTSPGAFQYQDFVTHWSVPEFAGYVAVLAEAADAALSAASDEGRRRAEDAFLETAQLERDFWQMAFEGHSA